MMVQPVPATPGLDPPDRPDLTGCDKEPIHIPGAIQPHGALLAACTGGLTMGGPTMGGPRVGDLLITHASANLAAVLDVPAALALGRKLHEIIGAAACDAIAQAPGRADHGWQHADHLEGPDGGSIHLHAHQSGSLLCIDMEPVPADGPRLPIAMVQSVLETFQSATTRTELCELAVQGLRLLTGYDRVMAYRFGENGDGEIIAEARGARLEPYLGLRYPASDIPLQARQLYLRQRVGAIVDSHYRPVPILVHPTLHDGTALDLTHSALRSVSPIHLEYMRNMGTAASLTIGLAHRQGLWGMLVCHHGTPRNPGTELRVAADMIGQVVSLLLGSLGQAEVYAQRFERADTLRCLIEKLSAPVPLMDAFAAAEMELLRLVNADGVMVRIGAGVLRLGRSPPVPAAERALSVLCRESNETLVAVEDLGLRHAALADCTEAGSGALLLKLSPTGEDAILWFRPELSQTIVWAGNPNKPAETGTGRMSPRKSFAAWQEIMHGHSARWQAADLALARELETAIEAEVAQRTKAELAKLRNYDALTGLPNRRLLQSRLAEDAQHPGATATSLLFLDLDRFKAVNDTLGHAAGDTLLVQVAERLVATAGADNLVARLGGDEFVVLSHGLDHAALAAMSERIRQAIETPFEIVDRACYISVSIGIASDDELSGFDLVRAADMAMYAAKKSGGNQGMVFDQSLYDRAAGRFELEHDLRVALSRDDQLVLVYQPVFGAGSFQDVVGFEARLRWNHPRQGWIAPDLFIPLAEKSGLMPPLGHWVLTQALRQAARFRVLRPDPVLILSVNIAPLQLAYPGFYADLLGLLRGANFPAASLCLEVPEGVLVDPMTAAVIAEARGLGAHVALDDFGMGQSSLSALRRLPVDTVKLDRSFLEPGDGNAGGASFIEAVTNLAHAAGLSVIAKGVETPAQLAAAVQGGVDGVQGFLLSPPLSAEAAAALLARPPSAGVPGEVSAGVSAGGERLG